MHLLRIGDEDNLQTHRRSGDDMNRVAGCLLVILALNSCSMTVQAQPDIVEEHWYHSYATLTVQVNDWADDYPDFVQLVSAGQTEMGREQWVVQISDWSVDASNLTQAKTMVYIDGGHHGNEHLGTELAFLVAEYYIEGAAAGDATILEVLRTSEIHIMIMLNADGNDFDTRWNVNQIDLNRNYDHMWSEEETRSGRGGPFSEAETRNNADYMNQYMKDADLYVTMHTGTWILAYPWGWTGDMPADWEMFTHIADTIHETIDDSLPIRNANAGIYPTHGTSRDYGYGVMGFPTFTFETDDEQWLLGTIEPLSERMALELDVMKYLIENANMWRAHLSTEEILIEDGTLTSIVSNTGHASTMNATLVASNSLGEVVWSSETFAVNATNSTSIRFEVPENVTSYDIDWSFEYQVRVVDASRFVTESISSDIFSFTEPKDDGFLVGFGVFNALTTTLAFVAVAALIRKEGEGIEGTCQEITCEN